MKKIKGIIVLTLAATLLLGGCSSNKTANSSNASATNENVYTIGINQLGEHAALDEARQGFEDGLKKLGVIVKIDYQNAQGDIPTSLTISQKFVRDKVDLIYAIGTPAAQSSKQATSDIPILFNAVTDPVKSELVSDWENVGGNITGSSDKADIDSQLAMFKEIDPTIGTIGILYSSNEANSQIQIEEIEKLAPNYGLKIKTIGISNVNELPQALDSLINKVDALYNLSDNLIASSVELVSKKLIENNMISVSAEETQVRGGILITNGLSYYELGKQTAQMAKEILVDKKDISTIPVGLAKKTITTINKNTLKELNLDENMELLKNAIKVGK